MLARDLEHFRSCLINLSISTGPGWVEITLRANTNMAPNFKIRIALSNKLSRKCSVAMEMSKVSDVLAVFDGELAPAMMTGLSYTGHAAP